jgi:hypothetical protein
MFTDWLEGKIGSTEFYPAEPIMSVQMFRNYQSAVPSPV